MRNILNKQFTNADILDRAVRLAADLIVIGTHGISGFEHLVLGSVTEKVLRKATCPVLTVPPRAKATCFFPSRETSPAIALTNSAVERSAGFRFGAPLPPTPFTCMAICFEANARCHTGKDPVRPIRPRLRPGSPARRRLT